QRGGLCPRRIQEQLALLAGAIFQEPLAVGGSVIGDGGDGCGLRAGRRGGAKERQQSCANCLLDDAHGRFPRASKYDEVRQGKSFWPPPGWTTLLHVVIPAKAGIHLSAFAGPWVPACAGTTWNQIRGSREHDACSS